MSDFRAIGGVSATLQTLLYDRMERPDGVPDVMVTVGAPRRPDDPPAREDPRVNLFLYRVTEHGYHQNQEIPNTGSNGAFGHPPLSLNLHYLVTAYGSEAVPNVPPALPPVFDERVSHFLLGSAMRVLHDVPVVTERLQTVTAPSGRVVLHESLQNAFEQVKITLEPLTLEDVTKVWTALSLRYRLSAAYQVTVVQIESQRVRSFPRPVGQPPSTIPPLPGSPPVPGPMVHVITIRTPSITDVRVRRALETEIRAQPYARIGDSLVLTGYNLAGGDVRVHIGELTIPVSNTDNQRLEVVIPDATIPGVGAILPERLLQPGARVVSVTVADPLAPQNAMRSNEGAFMLVPHINAPPVYTAAPTRRLTISGTRLVNASAPGETVIGRTVVPRNAYISATPIQIIVPLLDPLPMRGVRFVLGSPLPALVPVSGANPHSLDVTINGVTRTITGAFPPNVPRETLPPVLQSLIRDADPTNPNFAGTRVEMFGNRLLIIPGGLAVPISTAAPAGTTLRTELGLNAAPPTSVGHALLSGELAVVPVVTAATPRMTVQIGLPPANTISITRPTSIPDAALQLQAAINAIGGTPAYINAMVAPFGSRLLVIPGDASDVQFGAALADDLSVSELQLRARYAVRVRVNGAESVDDRFVDLPV